MAGWRIGYMVGNADLVHALARMKSYHDYGTFTPIQVASIAALEGPQDCVEEIRANYQRRRDVMVRGLHDLGWRVENPKASMYVWAKIPEGYAGMGSIEFTRHCCSRREDRGGAGHRLRRLRRRPRAHRAHREREPAAPGAARREGDVQEGRPAARRGMKPIHVGLLGIGTVGGGTWEVLQRNAGEIRRRAGRAIRISRVADKDLRKAREARRRRHG
jgi:hypothetical protein